MLAISGLFYAARSPDDPSDENTGSAPTLDVSWVPEGYQLFDGTTAYRWSTRRPVCPGGMTCWTLDVVAANNCPTLTVRVDVIDEQDRAIAQATGTTTSVLTRAPALVYAGVVGEFTHDRGRVASIRCGDHGQAG
jgi:hypothetical protein